MCSDRNRDADPGRHYVGLDPPAGTEVAARLGLTLAGYIDAGSNGSVNLLDDGRILKVTGSEGEAARSLLLMEAQTEGRACPGFPRIDRVVAICETSDAGDEMTYFGIVREEAADLPNGWTGGNDLALWMMALGMLGDARRDGREIADLGPASHCKAHLAEAYDAIAWAASTLGFAINDVRTSNFGVVGGRFVIRDFGPDDDAADVAGTVARIEPIPDLSAPAC
ncbi:hypothetical protein BHAOGJBA_5144 [Methylobacterium hispanicum]|uniref:Uncharacterized protein n=1 Tax=Methylobacterium hispanicum TaxID=270350 RepID=A0AAV4ZSM7_9HYPH|nr:hypothetical protein BHAOGJBA_5144 [Methylobacterium hispanicum]